MIVEGVHYLPDDPPGDVAWKLVAVNLSDLAAKGARPIGVLLGFTLGEAAWDKAFAEGLGIGARAPSACPCSAATRSRRRAPACSASPRIGRAERIPPDRSGATPGDQLWVSGAIGDAGAGLRRAARGGATRRP